MSVTSPSFNCLPRLVATSGNLPHSGEAAVKTSTDAPEFVVRAFASTRTHTEMASTASSEPMTKPRRASKRKIW